MAMPVPPAELRVPLPVPHRSQAPPVPHKGVLLCLAGPSLWQTFGDPGLAELGPQHHPAACRQQKNGLGDPQIQAPFRWSCTAGLSHFPFCFHVPISKRGQDTHALGT